MDSFMVRDTGTPMHFMLDLRSYGMKISWNTTTPGYVEWNRDQISYKTIQFCMPAFRGMVHGLLKITETLLLRRLLLLSPTESPPKIPWSGLTDNPSNDTIGWSFLQDERNSIFADLTPQWLLQRIQ
jgi:hypothetical protein